MQQHERTRLQRIAIDILGFGLILAAALTGWLPGPGGIPLLILGLSVLATNHAWAERLLHRVKAKGVQFSDTFFDGHPWVKATVDIVGVGLIALGVFLFNRLTGSVRLSAAISLVALGLALFFANRKRFTHLRQRFHKKP